MGNVLKEVRKYWYVFIIAFLFGSFKYVKRNQEC